MKVVTFSGIDGAGKSTQIDALEDWLRQAGFCSRLLTFWDNVVVLRSFREFLSHRAFGGDRGVGSPEKPLHRRDKNVTSWPVIAMRFCLYLADAVNTRRIVRKAAKGNVDVVIFDRYIYDEIANLPAHRWWARLFTNLLLWIAPKPDIAYVIDADPAAAFARKPEYPLDFVRRNREAYLALSRFADLTVIEPSSAEAMEIRVKDEFLRRSPGRETEVSAVPALE
ncbi:MAG: thymidylate kinase [Candidatus Sulfotelmatobacter sp.]